MAHQTPTDREVMTPTWEPQADLNRVTGGLLGAIAGEAWQRDRSRGQIPGDAGPVAAALIDLGHAYVARRGAAVPVEVATRHRGVPGPAWMLPVAIVRSDIPALVGNTLELAVGSGVPRHHLGRCVAYVELAACLLAGWSVQEAIRVVHAMVGGPDPGAAVDVRQLLTGEPIIDALHVGMWTLVQAAGITDVAPGLPTLTTPGVVAAAAGLLGLRDGASQIPPDWHPHLRQIVDCQVLAPALVRAQQAGRVADHLGSDGQVGWPARRAPIDRLRLRPVGSRPRVWSGGIR